MTKRARKGRAGHITAHYLLDRFSIADLRHWQTLGRNAKLYEAQLYNVLEAQRQEHYASLIESLRTIRANPFSFRNWVRISDYKYTLTPLSSRGSVQRIGGRFNFGKGISEYRFEPFNAYYLAEDSPTAWREKFLHEPTGSGVGLSEVELKLADERSLVHLSLRGVIEDLLDITNMTALKPFLAVIRDFKIPAAIRELTKELGLKPIDTVTTLSMLSANLLDQNWKARPMHHDIPSKSQIFGKIALDAGFEGILYPSVRGSGRCLALFPRNFKNSTSFVELQSEAPNDNVVTRMDATNFNHLI